MAKYSTLATLVNDAYSSRSGFARNSSGQWWADKLPCADVYGPESDYWVICVGHVSTEMFRVVVDGDGAPVRVLPIDSGWGSTTDRCGVRKITDGAGISTGYRELFGC